MKRLLGILLAMVVVGCGSNESVGDPRGDPVAALEKLEARIERNERGEVIGVELSGTQVSDEEMAHLKPLANLQVLHLFNTQIGDTGLIHLQGMTNLRELGLGRTQITDEGLVHLKNLTGLQTLDLKETSRGLVQRGRAVRQLSAAFTLAARLAKTDAGFRGNANAVARDFVGNRRALGKQLKASGAPIEYQRRSESTVRHGGDRKSRVTVALDSVGLIGNPGRHVSKRGPRLEPTTCRVREGKGKESTRENRTGDLHFSWSSFFSWAVSFP